MLLNIKSLSKKFNHPDSGKNKPIQVLNNLDLSLDEGQTLAILGSSGSGKSTLLSIIAGIEREFEGDLTFKNQNFKNLTEAQITALRANEIGIVFQQYHLIEHLTALENVMLPLEILNIPEAQLKAKALLDKVGLQDRHHHFAAALSGGEKQRVAICRATVAKRSLILADEPTGSLDEKNGHLIIDLFFDLVSIYKSALIIVTHSMEVAKKAGINLTLTGGKLA